MLACAITARNDSEAIQAFLGEYRQSPATLRRFAKETERLLLWLHARQAQGRVGTLRDPALKDLHDYEDFLRHPNVSWASAAKVRQYLRDGSLNPVWRPFVKVLDRQGNLVRCGLREE